MSLLGLHRAEIVRLERERDAALALAERRAGEIAAMKEQLRTLTAGFWYVDFHDPYLSAGHYLRLNAAERLEMDALAAALAAPPPPPDAAAPTPDTTPKGEGDGD